MIQLQRLLFFISLFFTISLVSAQETKELDTVKDLQIYGLRLGVDISKPIIALFNDDYNGFEFTADARFYKKFYVALEIGYDNNTTDEDYMNFTTKGSYFKLGANYNAYDNWVGMTNEIYVGARYGVSFFEHTVNYYTPNIYGEYIDVATIEANTNYPDLSAQWLEFVLGIRAEAFKNFYMGFSFSFKILTTSKEPENFDNLYAPGFNNISLNNMGFGFNFTLSYLIPFAKKYQ